MCCVGTNKQTNKQTGDLIIICEINKLKLKALIQSHMQVDTCPLDHGPSSTINQTTSRDGQLKKSAVRVADSKDSVGQSTPQIYSSPFNNYS